MATLMVSIFYLQTKYLREKSLYLFQIISEDFYIYTINIYNLNDKILPIYSVLV